MTTTPWPLIRAGVAPSPGAVRRALEDSGEILGDDGLTHAAETLSTNVLGAGPLERYLRLPDVTDVLVNGLAGVWIDRGNGIEPVPCDVGGPEEVRRLAVRLAGLAGRRLDDSCPVVDGLLSSGVRLHAVLPPLVDGAAHVSLRVPRRAFADIGALGARGAFPPAVGELLRRLVGARVSFVVSGGTGTGKTTLLAAMLKEVDAAERMLLVEDVREMAVDHPHVVRLTARPPNIEGAGGVDLVALVRASLRMRPDRLIVGEVRGAEVREMLTALNTGHDGGACTVHANSVDDVMARFEALGALGGLDSVAVRTQVASALRVVVHLRRHPHRHVCELGVVLRSPARIVPAVQCTASGEITAAEGLPELLALLGVRRWPS